MATEGLFDIVLQDATLTNPGAVFDNEWVKSTFIITDRDLGIDSGSTELQYEKWIRINRYSTSATHKFTSTSPGMSYGVNPKPQFTRYCDIRDKGRLPNRPDINPTTTGHPQGLGMGGYYSEAIDDNQQRIFFRFGVPQYMPLPIWLIKSFDIHKTVLQGRGIITSTFLTAINVVTKFFALSAAFPLAITMYALGIIVDNSRFYSVKDTMYTYWATVDNILNSLVARRTMMPYILQDYTYKLQKPVGTQEAVSSTFINSISKLIPDIVDEKTGRISIYAIALRAQATFNSIKYQELQANKSAKLSNNISSFYDIEGVDVTSNMAATNATNPAGGILNYLFNYAHAIIMDGNPDNTVNTEQDAENASLKDVFSYNETMTDADGNILNLSLDSNDPNNSIDNQIQSNINTKASRLEKYQEYMLAELTEGAMFAVFNVENTGSVGESFSSSFGSNPIETTFNSISAKARNIGSMVSSATNIPIVGDALKLAKDAMATVLSNATLGIANPLLALAYGVNVSMPKVWESSSASLPRASYKIKLISPYGNPYSQLFNIYMPLAMLLAGALPRSTGNSTYMSPFFCQLFDRGRVNIQLGMIDSLQLTRGTANLPFNRTGHANAIDVDLTVANMDEVVSVDVTSNNVLSNAIAALDPNFSDTPFTTYINTLASVDVYSQTYRFQMLRLKLAERMMAVNAVINPDPAAFGAMTVNAIPFGQLLKNVLGDNTQALQNLNNF